MSSEKGKWAPPEESQLTGVKPSSLLHQQVCEFHEQMDIPIAHKPVIPPDERVKLRLLLITEEFFETVSACLSQEISEMLLHHAQDCVIRAIGVSKVDVNLPELADGLADLDYVVEGTRLEFGIDGHIIANEVHRANMTKVGGPIREDGKRLKPPGFTPPNIVECLECQGWKNDKA